MHIIVEEFNQPNNKAIKKSQCAAVEVRTSTCRWQYKSYRSKSGLRCKCLLKSRLQRKMKSKSGLQMLKSGLKHRVIQSPDFDRKYTSESLLPAAYSLLARSTIHYACMMYDVWQQRFLIDIFRE